MSDAVRWTSGQQPGRQEPKGGGDGANLADILERVLDKGIVIAGDIQVNLLDIELLTIKIRLVVASVDRAKEMGIDWWERDPTLSAGRQELENENDELRSRIAALEAAMGRNGALPEGEDLGDEDHDGADLDDPDADDPDADEEDVAEEDRAEDLADDDPAGQDEEPVAEPRDREREPDEPAADDRPRTRSESRAPRRRDAGSADRAGARRGRTRDR